MKQAPKSAMRLFLVPTTLGLLISVTISLSSCKKDEPPPPLPAASEAVEEPAPMLTLAPEEDAGAEDADAAPKATGTYTGGKSLAKCCAALSQNAANAPAPTNTYMMTAAGICQGMVAGGRDNAAILAAVRAAMRGAALPAGCN